MNLAEAYHLLGFPIDEPIGESKLEQAYRACSKEVHPDKGGTPEAFQKITQARDLISSFIKTLEVPNPRPETHVLGSVVFDHLEVELGLPAKVKAKVTKACQPCSGSGKATPPDKKCPNCKGSGKISDPGLRKIFGNTCPCTGEELCPICGGIGYSWVDGEVEVYPDETTIKQGYKMAPRGGGVIKVALAKGRRKKGEVTLDVLLPYQGLPTPYQIPTTNGHLIEGVMHVSEKGYLSFNLKDGTTLLVNPRFRRST